MNRVAAVGPTAGALPVSPRALLEPESWNPFRAPDPTSVRARALVFVGVVYVIATLLGSYNFLLTASSVLANDYFWVNFNATTGGTFVALAFNSILSVIQAKAEAQLTDPQSLQVSTIPLSAVPISFPTHYARLVQYHRLTSIEAGIAGLRQTAATKLLSVCAQFCWVDVERRWSLAHTEARAKRCLRDHVHNGAMYLELALRNVNWQSFMARHDDSFAIGIQNAVLEFPDGQAFFDSIKLNATVPVSDEVAYWRSKGITHFTLQWHNLGQLGIDEKISIVNAFGISKALTIKHNEYVSRWSIQTTVKLYWCIVNDLWAIDQNNTRIGGMSLVRNASNFYEKAGITMEDVIIEDGNLPWPLPTEYQALRARLGPFGSIDTFWIMFPPELSRLFQLVRAIVLETALASEAARDMYLDISSGTYLQARPWFWDHEEWQFTGGSPLCDPISPVPYVTRGFEFNDGCGHAIDEVWTLDRLQFVSAYLVADVFRTASSLTDLVAICRAGTLATSACATGFAQAKNFSLLINETARNEIRAFAALAHQALLRLNISTMQYVMKDPKNVSSVELLVEQVISADIAAPWNVFGWLTVFEWVMLRREVVSFQGDYGTLVLMSSATAAGNGALNAAEITDSMSTVLRLFVQYVSLVLTIVAVVVLAYVVASRFQVAGKNLFEFNRVCGVVWIGRPLLALRGIVAIALLSTSRPQVLTTGPFYWMEDTSREWTTAIITAGEATWLLCVIIDVLLVVIRGWAYIIAPVSHALVWTVVAVLQLISPTQHVMVVDPQCQFVALDLGVTCTGGRVHIGSFSRLLELVLITCVCVFCCSVLVRMCCRRDALRADGTCLPGIAHEKFVQRGWIHDGRWYLDRASSIMAGLVSAPMGTITTVVDFKSWSVLHEKDKERQATASLRPHLRQAICLKSLQAKTNTD